MTMTSWDIGTQAVPQAKSARGSRPITAMSSRICEQTLARNPPTCEAWAPAITPRMTFLAFLRRTRI